MTIAQLLSLNGARTPRYITVAGRTVFGSVSATASGLIHPEHGPVTQVADHTFHGGADVEDEGHAHWWEDDVRIVRHIAAMKQSFPGFDYVAADGELAPHWRGQIDTGRGAFRIGVFLRHDEGLPFVKVLSKQRLGRNCGGRFVPSPHLYVSGALCIADQDDWDPQAHTAATATAWAAHWLAAFTEWRIMLKWPVEGAHAAA